MSSKSKKDKKSKKVAEDSSAAAATATKEVKKCKFDTKEIDDKLGRLRKQQDPWTQLSFKEKLIFLKKISDNVDKYASEWVDVVIKGKQVDAKFAAEEWAGGPYSTIAALKGYVLTYEVAAAKEEAGKPITFAAAPSIKEVNGQKRVLVFPTRTGEKMSFPNTTAEIWLEPGKEATQGTEVLDAKKANKGQLSLILGAGNQTSIPILDALYKLYNQNQVCILKHNPAAQWFAPIVDKIMEPFITADYFHHITGGVEEGQYLVEQCDNVHITGSDKTHDAIVWGSPTAAKKGKPLYTKEITSELGCVTPFIIVPGDWTSTQLDYVVQHVLGAIVTNNSFNCNAAKVIVTDKNWKLRDKFLDAIKAELAKQPSRVAWYPGAANRYKAFRDAYPKAEALGAAPTEATHIPWTFIPDVPLKSGEYALCTEPFCPIISESCIDAKDVPSFMKEATDMCNDKIWGNLSCSVFIDPTTESKYKNDFEDMVSGLKYGGVAINAWSGVLYAFGYTTWGAYPGNPVEDIQSGKGVVHNTFLFDHPQKSVARVPFQMPMGAKMPYFPNHKNAAKSMEALLHYDHNPTFSGLVGSLWQSLWG